MRFTARQQQPLSKENLKEVEFSQQILIKKAISINEYLSQKYKPCKKKKKKDIPVHEAPTTLGMKRVRFIQSYP